MTTDMETSQNIITIIQMKGCGGLDQPRGGGVAQSDQILKIKSGRNS